MTKVLQDYLPRTISQYVPLMEFAADVLNGEIIVSLGTPPTADPNGILDDASATNSATSYNSSDWATTFDGSATSVTTTSGMLGARFGQCLTAQGTAGSDHVVTVIGRDYLGQPMRENMTLSGTTVMYGEKAFKFVDQVDVATGAASDTFDLGWDDRLGLPYAAEAILSWTEDNVNKPVGTDMTQIVGVAAETASVKFGLFNDAGFVTRMDAVTTEVIGTGNSTTTLEIGGTAVAGISTVSLTASSAIGDVATSNATDDHGATSKVAANGAIEAVNDGGATTTGIVDIIVFYSKNILFIDADDTTQTATTGDPRGTVQPFTSCDGAIEYEVRYTVDVTNMHGVAHFNG